MSLDYRKTICSEDKDLRFPSADRNEANECDAPRVGTSHFAIAVKLIWVGDPIHKVTKHPEFLVMGTGKKRVDRSKRYDIL